MSISDPPQTGQAGWHGVRYWFRNLEAIPSAGSDEEPVLNGSELEFAANRFLSSGCSRKSWRVADVNSREVKSRLR